MKTLSLCNYRHGLFSHVELTEHPGERMRGLLGRNGLPEGHAMWFVPCASVHTFFMRFTIDLIFLDRDHVVTDVRMGVRPWRMVFGKKGSYSVLEMESGWLKDVVAGQKISISQE